MRDNLAYKIEDIETTYNKEETRSIPELLPQKICGATLIGIGVISTIILKDCTAALLMIPGGAALVKAKTKYNNFSESHAWRFQLKIDN